jgi:hypothetical protein
VTQAEKNELAALLTELYQLKRVLRTSTVSYCRERLEESIEKLERLLAK